MFYTIMKIYWKPSKYWFYIMFLMIYDCFTLVEYLSTAFTLMPGDLVPTGTPEGSALSTQNWLKPGDRVKVEIENIGFIENNIIQEPKSTTKY